MSDSTTLSSSPAVANQPWATKSGAPGSASAPAPKQAEHWDGKSVPTAEQVMSPGKPALDGANRKVLEEAVSAYQDAAYQVLERGLDLIATSLHDPPKPPDPSFANEVMVFLVKQLTVVATMVVGGGIIDAAAGLIGDAAIGIMKAKLTVGSKQAADALGGLVREKPPGSMRYVPPESPSFHAANPSAKTLLDEFLTRQRNALTARKADAHVMLSLVGAIPNIDLAKLEELAQNLRSAAEGNELGGQFQEQVTLGWMNFCAAVALGERNPGEPEFKGANTPGGIRAQTARGNSEFGGGQEGFINIEIDVPDTIWGTNSLRLASMTSPHASAGLVQTLRSRNSPILATPVYRRIYLGQSGQGPLGWDPVMIIGPDGTLSIDVDQPLLAAIGRLTPIDRASAAVLPNGETNRASFASLGASLLTSWLGQIKTGQLQ